MITDFKDYRDSLILIAKINDLPDQVYLDGITFRKSFSDTNMIQHSKDLTSPFDIRVVRCGFGGRNANGDFIIAEVTCHHSNVCGDVYFVSIKNKSILDKILTGV